MALYTLRSNPNPDQLPYIITKFDADLEVESVYYLGNTACECPAGHRPKCRHRDMLPSLKPRIDTAWFYCFETKSWEDPTRQAKLEEDQVPSMFECPDCHADLSIATHAFGCTWLSRQQVQPLLNAAPSAETQTNEAVKAGFRRRI